jgi:hypothetical protein
MLHDGIISDPNGIVPLDSGIPIHGMPAAQPYYQSPATPYPSQGIPAIQDIPSEPIPMGFPTPASPIYKGSSSRNAPPTSRRSPVQQVSYEQSVDAEPAASHQPVAVRKAAKRSTVKLKATTVKPQAPARDAATSRSGMQRLIATTIAKTDAASTKNKTAAKRQPTNNNTKPNTAAVHSGNMNWERLGLTRPASSHEGNRARIKAN